MTMTHGVSSSLFPSSVCPRSVPSVRCHNLAAGALLPRDSLPREAARYAVDAEGTVAISG